MNTNYSVVVILLLTSSWCCVSSNFFLINAVSRRSEKLLSLNIRFMNSVLLKVYLFPKRSSTSKLATISIFGSSVSQYFYNDVFLYRSILGTINAVETAFRIKETISFLSRYPSFPVSKISQKISTFAYDISRLTISAKHSIATAS